MTVTSCSFSSSSRERFQPTLPAPATMTYMSGPLVAGTADGGGRLAERGALELVDRDRGRAHGLEPLLGVPGGAPRVEHTRDHARDVEAPPRDLGHHEVRVVAVRGGDEDVGA